MKSESKRLHALGLAIHWLAPRSKRPLEMKWASGERKSETELASQYRPGMNLGVRLGKASYLGGGYLAVIDCDVKSEALEDRKEMEAALAGHLSLPAPTVRSGRGNGSRHLYVVTQTPTKAKLLARSEKIVQVKMPSATQPSRKEKEQLSEDELRQGIRLRPAWEISLLGEGQQVVLPPSIHPDTGKAYQWKRPLEQADDIPRFIPPAESASPTSRGEHAVVEDFKVTEVDLVGSGLPVRVISQIMNGEGVEDRSAALLGVMNAMLRYGMSDSEILSVLTDKEFFLGGVAYGHAQTTSRLRAAKWLAKYTLAKAKKEVLATEQFNDGVEIEDIALAPEVKEKQIKELLPPEGERDWMLEVERGGPEERPKPTLKNILLILRNAVSPEVFKRNLFSGTNVYGHVAPWNDAAVGDAIRDIDITNIVFWFIKQWRFEPQENRVFQAVSQIASHNKFHPVRDYLAGLEWDGVRRVDGWIKTYLGGNAPEPYLSAVSRKTLVAMVARVMNPGCKFDHVLILEGLQGKGKSTAVSILASPWFSDATLNVADKDAVLTMSNVWVVELGELQSVRRADADVLKAFISRREDRIRMPYGRLAENFPRQCIFIGTTNQEEYLKDDSGNRRFWPVSVGRCDFDALKKDRDQLMAEAAFLYELGEPLYLSEEEERIGAQAEQEKRMFHDEWEGIVGDFLNNSPPNFDVNRFTITDLFGDFGPLCGEKPTRAHVMRVCIPLRRLGYQKLRKRVGGSQKVYWERETKNFDWGAEK